MARLEVSVQSLIKMRRQDQQVVHDTSPHCEHECLQVYTKWQDWPKTAADFNDNIGPGPLLSVK